MLRKCDMCFRAQGSPVDDVNKQTANTRCDHDDSCVFYLVFSHMSI